MRFCVTETSGRGMPPDPHNAIPRARRRPPGIGPGPGAGRAGLPHAPTASRPWSAMPNSPASSRSANGSAAASKRRSNHLPAKGSLVWERPEGKGPGVRKRARPRTRSSPSDWWVAPSPARTSATAPAGRAAKPQDVAAPPDIQAGWCASRERQNVHLPPASLAHLRYGPAHQDSHQIRAPASRSELHVWTRSVRPRPARLRARSSRALARFKAAFKPP